MRGNDKIIATLNVLLAEELTAIVRSALDPIQERRRELERKPSVVRDALAEGTRRAAPIVRQTVERVREAMSLAYPGVFREAP